MIEFILKENIDRRIKKEVLADEYFAETLLMRIDNPVIDIMLDNSIYFLINEHIDIPNTAKLIITSPDAFFSTSKFEYDLLQSHNNQSFRNKIKVKLINYGVSFTPFTLEFLKVTPITNK
jgi:hypothetical protein